MKHAIATLILAVSVFVVNGQDFVIDTDELIDEIQKSSDNEDRVNLIWWIPTEFWEASLGEESEEVQQIISVLDQYTVFAVVDGEIGAFGSVHYVPLKELKKDLTITDRHGDVFTPVDDKDVDQETSMFLQIMRPVFTNMLGSLGENMHFVLFPKENLEGKRLLNPYIEGEFVVKMLGESYEWETPLGSLFAKKHCPVDDRTWNGTWKYCPVHGKELTE
jgi:hypothetical protein